MISPAPPTRRWMFASALLPFLGSMGTHAAIVVALLFGATTRMGAAGEDGRGGAGDTTIDISVAGSNLPPTAPAEVVTTLPPTTTPPTVAPPTTDDKTAQDTTERPTPLAKPVTAPPASQPANATGNAETTSSGKLPGPTRIGFPSGAFDGSTIDGQRALLPAAASCADPVAGRWEALKFSPTRRDWVRFTLVVRRYGDGAIGGTILSHTWSGNAFDRVPPACGPDSFDLTVSMNGSGHAEAAGRITFGATRFSIVSIQCASLGADYAPDHFSGVIDANRGEFQSLNNDGAADVNAPYVFRRTGCL